MLTGKGIGVFSGTATGKIFLYKKQEITITDRKVTDAEEEVKVYFKAKETATQQLKELFDKTVIDVGEEEAMIIDVQLMMLDDLDYEEAIVGMIKDDEVNAAYAIHTVGEQFAEMFASMDDEYMKARSVDVRDISNRLAMNASGKMEDGVVMNEPMIIVAEDLAPSETVQFDKSKILAFVTQKGSSNSHTAILARTMNIPSIVCADIELNDDIRFKTMVVDGTTGTYYIDPTDDVVSSAAQKAKGEEERRKSLLELKGKKNVTLCGKTINIFSNIGSPDDIEYVLDNDAGGIGLFRSEFLYLGRTDYPTEEEQFEAYKTVAEKMDGKKVIIRTLDIGADKQADYFNLDKEENPAMGLRAIRICLTDIKMFKTQLRALYRASVYGNISIMFPMITAVKEVKLIKEILLEVKSELIEENIPLQDMEIGVMIETPAAVMISDDLAKEVDFFSVGTNDLTQYTLAIDRQNQKLDRFYDSHHPAVMKMLQMIVDNAHANGIWAGICGELASDLSLTETFLRMGYDELSVAPTFTLELRKAVRDLKLD